jgi:hypothetical protein
MSYSCGSWANSGCAISVYIAIHTDVENSDVYIAVNYIGLLNELMLFDRASPAEEVGLLHGQPGLLAPLRKGENRAR